MDATHSTEASFSVNARLHPFPGLNHKKSSVGCTRGKAGRFKVSAPHKGMQMQLKL